MTGVGPPETVCITGDTVVLKGLSDLLLQIMKACMITV